MKKTYDEQTMLAARETLSELLQCLPDMPNAHFHLPKVWREFEETFAHLGNVEGVLIQQTELGGWHFDIILKEVPVGFPKIVGSSSAHPFRKQEDARHAATEFLALFRRQAKKDADTAHQAADGEVWFSLHNHHVALPGVMFEFARTTQMLRPVERETAAFKLEGALIRLGLREAGDDTIQERIDDLDPDEKYRLLSALCSAHAAGIFRFPQARSLSPSGHDEHLTIQ